MRKKPITVAATDDREAVAHRIAKYNLLAVPVIEADGEVAGFVTVDDVIDVMIEEQTEDILRMAAVEPGAMDKPYFDNPVWRVVRKRVGWLLLLFVGGTLTGTVLRHFEGELSAVVALSFFIPMLIGTGGNAGAQTVMTVIRSLALGEIRFRDAWKVVLREATTGLTVGLMIAVAAFGQALLDRRVLDARHHGRADHARHLPVVDRGGRRHPARRPSLRARPGRALGAR